MLHTSSLRRALAVSVVLHAVAAALAWAVVPQRAATAELVDIEVAPPPPAVEALPPERAQPLGPLPMSAGAEAAEAAMTGPSEPADRGTEAADAGVDAAVDARADAAVDAAPDAAPDARADAAVDARADAAVDARADAAVDARADAAPDPDAEAIVASADRAVPTALEDAGALAASADAGAADAEATAQGAPRDAGDDLAAAAAVGDAAVASQAAHGAGAGGDTAVAATAVGDAAVASQAARGAGGGGDAAVATAASGSGSSQPSPVAAGDAAASDAGGSSGPLGAIAAWLAPSGRGGAATGSGSAARLDTAALAAELAARPTSSATGTTAAIGATGPIGATGSSDEPAVPGAPTTAGTAANLLAYMPAGHVVTALIRFDRLRGTEWSAQTERLLRPLPDYQWLFGNRDADLADQLDTLIISTPRPRDAAATTLVAHTHLARRELRDFLGAGAPVRWSASAGGLLGRRTGKLFPGDPRLFLSPFRGWFVLAQPADLAGLTAAAAGDPDQAVATAPLPPWLAGIRTIESETGDPRGPAGVITIALDGQRISLAGRDFGLGVASLPTPDRISIAVELVAQGWLVRGNLHCASDADAAELIATIQRVQGQIAGSYPIQLVLGKPIARVVANLAFARAGARVSYATSISIADARAILSALAQQVDQYFGRAP